MSVTGSAERLPGLEVFERIESTLDPRTLEILERRRRTTVVKRRGWLMRRMLLASDLAGLALSFVLAEWIYGAVAHVGRFDAAGEAVLFAVSLPVWVVMAKLYGLYDRDEERTDHSTADDVMGVFHLVTVGTWLLFAGAYLTELAHPQVPKLLTFWALAAVAVPLLRSAARARCRRSIHYLQNAVIVGAGDVGQDVARKLLKHPEYGINLVGLVDGRPKERADDLGDVAILGTLEDIPTLVRLLDIERVIVAFSNDDLPLLLGLVRDLNELDVQVDVVPRFYEVLSSAVDLHSVEGLPLLGVRPPRLSRSSAFLKRQLDIVASAIGLLLLSPLFALLALAIKLDSKGPVFFRQVRMGARDQTFRIVKFRTMTADADERKPEIAHLNKHAHGGGDARMFKIEDDPQRHPGRPLVPSHLHRRAATVLERAEGRDEPRGAAAADSRRARARHRLGRAATRSEAGNHRPLAGTRARRHPVRGDDQARLPVCHLVESWRRHAPAPADDSDRGARSLMLVMHS